MEPAEVLEGSNEWEQVQSPSHQPRFSSASGGDDTTTDFPAAVGVRGNYLRIQDEITIFPPNNHEGLPVPQQENQPLRDPTQASNTSSFLAESPANEVDEMGPGGTGRRLGSYLRLLRSGIDRVAFVVRNYAVCGVFLGSFLCVAGAMMLSVLYVKVRRWGRKFRRENEDRLMMLIREKDKVRLGFIRFFVYAYHLFVNMPIL
ncbi:hypothetical protein Acr_13g0016250 [Actinidia rufa]|uniref:Transmembrane protein n=1 Tax=Actinidia rufa TaxID=165716 RepID=A0A7J0FND8_9ERIC|nr:hypothetical protein Acr_13g0016250 [Actinidia rufa]